MFDRLRSRGPHLLVALLALAALRPSPAPQVLESGWRAAALGLAHGRPAAALSALEALQALEPDLLQLRQVAAVAALAAGNPQRAIELTAPLGRDDPASTCLRAEALVDLGKPDTALQLYQALPVTCTAGQAAPLLRRLAGAFLALRRPDQAVELLEQLDRLEPSQSATQLQLGLALAVQSPDEALGPLRSADSLIPGGNPLARALIRAVQDARPTKDPAYTLAQVGITLTRFGEWPLAAAAFSRSLVFQPGYTEARAYLGLALDRLGQDGLKDLQAAAAAAPGLSLTHTLLGLHWRMAGKPEAAQAELEVARRLDPQNPAVVAELAAALAEQGDLTAAKEAYRAAAEGARDDPGFWLLLAEFSLDHEIEVSTLGLPAARNALALAPGQPAELDALGYAYYLLANLPLAERFLTQAVAAAPDQAAPQWHLGLLRMAQGDRVRGRAAFDLAARLDPLGPEGLRARRSLEKLGS